MWTESWPTLYLVTLRDSLDGVVKLVSSPPAAQNDDVTRALTSFLIVRASGYLEQATEECCRAFLRGKSIPQVSTYGASWLGRGAMPLPGSLVALVGRFDAGWASQLQDLFDTDDERLKRDVTQLVELRKRIAHGSSGGTSARRALELTEHAVLIADWFVGCFDPR
jgi:hypothetical protein